MKVLDAIKNIVRGYMTKLAATLDSVSGGKLTPEMITWTGFFAHLPIAWLIISNQLLAAGILLIIFGLFDTLDGSLARLQGTASTRGMFLDSVTDRLKEVLLYSSLVVLFTDQQASVAAVFAATSLGVSICISYVNAWGEVAISQAKIKHQTNKAIRSGLMGFEVRMFMLVIGLMTGRPDIAVVIISLLGIHTLGGRIIQVLQKVS